MHPSQLTGRASARFPRRPPLQKFTAIWELGRLGKAIETSQLREKLQITRDDHETRDSSVRHRTYRAPPAGGEPRFKLAQFVGAPMNIALTALTRPLISSGVSS